LHAYSSMQVYQMAADADAARFGKLYERCAATPGVHYVGSLPQPQLAEALQQVSLLSYPNHFPETSCISVMEAMACGCHVVTSELGALPETLGGFGTLVSVENGWQQYRQDFIAAVVAGLLDLTERAQEWDQKLQEQVETINRECTWSVRAQQWHTWLLSGT